MLYIVYDSPPASTVIRSRKIPYANHSTTREAGPTSGQTEVKDPGARVDYEHRSPPSHLAPKG